MDTIRIQIKAFATTRQILGSDKLSLEIPAGSTVTDLLGILVCQYPDLQTYLPHILATVNQQYSGRDQVLQDNDTVAVFPPVSGGMDETHLALSETTIDVSELVARVTEPGAGAVVTFLGVVRDNNLGRSVNYLEYEAYTEMALEKMQQVVDEIRRQWPKVRRVALVHRVGHLELGEVATVIAAGAPHRNDGAFEATRYAIDRIKEIVPIWKKEGWSDGAEWLEGDYQPSPGE